MIWLVSALAFAGDSLPDADLVVIGAVTSADDGGHRGLWNVARTVDFHLTVPDDRPAHLCLKITEVVVGDLFGEEVCFWRVGFGATGLAPQVGNAGVWFLERGAHGDVWYTNEAGTWLPQEEAAQIKMLLAQRDREPPSLVAIKGAIPAIADAASLRQDMTNESGIPSVKLTIEGGTPAQKRDAIGIAAQYNAVDLVPTLIAALTDASLVPGTTPQRPVGTYAAEALYLVSTRLDGIDASGRSPDQFAFPGGAMGFSTRSTAVQQAWNGWWSAWKEKGPPAKKGDDE